MPACRPPPLLGLHIGGPPAALLPEGSSAAPPPPASLRSSQSRPASGPRPARVHGLLDLKLQPPGRRADSESGGAGVTAPGFCPVPKFRDPHLVLSPNFGTISGQDKVRTRSAPRRLGRRRRGAARAARPRLLPPPPTLLRPPLAMPSLRIHFVLVVLFLSFL